MDDDIYGIKGVSESLLQIYYINNKTMKPNTTTRSQNPKEHSSQQDEQIFVKNLQTGQAQNSKELIKHHHSLILDKQSQGKVWGNYLKSIKKMQDKLLELVIHRSHNELKNILIQYPVELSQIRYMDGWTLLHFAVGQSDYNIAQTLLQFGIDVDIQTTGMLRTALHQASFGNKTELVKLLVEWGADPNIVDADRNTAIHFAVDYGYDDIVKIILKSHTTVDLNIRNCMNMTTFNTCRNPDIFQILIDYEEKMKKRISSRETSTTISKHQGQNYQSRLIIRNSDVFPCTSRADMVEKFLSLRQAPAVEKKVSNDVESIISEESIDESLQSYEEDLSRSNKRKKRIGNYLKNKSIMRSKRIASQNIGLVKQSIFMTYLQGKESVDNFDILRQLGEGSFAEVFLVRRKQSSSLYALKKIDKKTLIQNNFRKYIQAEKHILTKVRHPFILQAYSCLQDFTHLYILMQFCEYGDLEGYVRKEKLSEDITKSYACEAALALEEIHRNGFLYRDLKASNILIDREGHLRLADFGLAKQATTSDSFLGSVSYMAPQMLAQGERKPHGKAVDWYLFGILIYEMLHGEPPFYTEDRQQMEDKIRNQQPQFDPNISQQVKEVILRLLQKNPSKRVQGLQGLKSFAWFAGINWTTITERKGSVMKLPKLDMKELRRKQFYESDEDKLIDEKIEWFEDWNYPKEG